MYHRRASFGFIEFAHQPVDQDIDRGRFVFVPRVAAVIAVFAVDVDVQTDGFRLLDEIPDGLVSVIEDEDVPDVLPAVGLIDGPEPLPIAFPNLQTWS